MRMVTATMIMCARRVVRVGMPGHITSSGKNTAQVNIFNSSLGSLPYMAVRDTEKFT